MENGMIKARIKKTGIVVYIHEGRKPNMSYNYGKIVVSKQPNSNSVFCADKNDLEIL